MQNTPLQFDTGSCLNVPHSASRIGVAVGCALLWLVGLVFAQTSDVRADSPLQVNDPQKIAALVTRLRAPSFRERVQAEADCRESGPAVLPALMDALKSPDPELRRRAQLLIEQIEVDGLDDSIESFLAPGSTTTLPGWSVVADLVEDSPEFRVAYAEILRGNTQVARALTHPKLITTELQRQIQNMGGGFGTVPQSHSAASTSAIFVMLLHPEANIPEDWANMTGRAVRQGAIQGVNETVPGQLLQALVARWAITPRAGAVSDRLEISRRLSLPESVTPALEMLKDKSHPHQLNVAFLAIMRHGGAAEMSVVEALLVDSLELNAQQGPDTQKTSSTQLRDLALATLIEMNKQDPRQFGMPALPRDASGNVSHLSVAFASDAERDAAFDKWRTWSAKNLRKYRPLPATAQEGTGI